MKVSRRTQIRILWVLNELIPPIIRDARWFMIPLMCLAFRRHTALALGFKERAYAMSFQEFVYAYEQVSEISVTKHTDLNAACAARILDDVVGSTLEVGCGKGALAVDMSRSLSVTACDIVIDPLLVRSNPQIQWCAADAESLPFADAAVDTVVCTHTLEHVRDLTAAIAELRRVGRRRMVVVVPKERPYRYTFNLHLHFFPYTSSLRAAMSAARSETRRARCEVVDGDLYYVEELAPAVSAVAGQAGG